MMFLLIPKNRITRICSSVLERFGETRAPAEKEIISDVRDYAIRHLAVVEGLVFGIFPFSLVNFFSYRPSSQHILSYQTVELAQSLSFGVGYGVRGLFAQTSFRFVQ